MFDFCSYFESEIKSFLVSHGHKPFRARQMLQWVYDRSVFSPLEMTNLSKELRQWALEKLEFNHLTLKSSRDSQDGETKKILWQLKDGRLIESVLICSGERRSLCVTSQVGCNARCSFCASGKKGKIRDLNTAEIVEQYLQVNRLLESRGEKITHIIFMGMGEPLDNYEVVTKAIRILCHPQMGKLSQRRITISTVGVVDKIEALLKEEDLHVNLALSLHAPNQSLRQRIIPYARKYPLEDVLNAVRRYSEKTKRDITFEYTLIEGVNDSEECAKELARLLSLDQATVNLIPYNPIPGLKWKRPSAEAIKKFRLELYEAGQRNTQRYTKGKDIAAACGQLALQEV